MLPKKEKHDPPWQRDGDICHGCRSISYVLRTGNKKLQSEQELGGNLSLIQD